MELTLVLLFVLVLVVAWGAMPRPTVRRVPAERHGRAREDGPTIYLTDHREQDRPWYRRVLPVATGLVTLVAALVAIAVGADL